MYPFLTVFTLLNLLTFNVAGASTNTHLGGRFGLGASAGLGIPLANDAFNTAVDTGWTLGGHAQYFLNDSLGLFLGYKRLQYKDSLSKVNAYQLGAKVRFSETACLSPVAGFNFVYENAFASNTPQLNFDNIGLIAKLGLDYSLNSNLIAGIEAAYAWFFTKANGAFDHHSLLPSIHLTYFFGADAKEETHSKSESPQADGDRDQDGVKDSVDQCPNTQKGTPVNSLGCDSKEKVNVTIQIQFDSGKSEIKPEHHLELEKIAALLNGHKDVKAEIQGHTDSSGNRQKNLELSSRRATAVMNYLKDKLQVSAGQVSAKGYGPDQPVADNKTAAGRIKNRRVVTSISTQ